MEIYDKNTYLNTVYKAVVVNSDTSLDPQGLNRLQIFIPSLQTTTDYNYIEYMNSSDKKSHNDFNSYPWAVTLISNLKDGNVVYGTTINNEYDSYLILGVEGGNIDEGVDINSNNASGTVNGSDVLSLAMPIILENEIGNVYNKDGSITYLRTLYPDNIPDEKYTKITPYDGVDNVRDFDQFRQGWSIGLIQWHHTRAYDCMYEICKADTDWKNKVTDKELNLFKDLETSLNSGSTSKQRGSYCSSFHPIPGTELYKSIQNILGSDIGKHTQLSLASQDTLSAIDDLKNNFNVNNIGILIYTADMINQYGDSVPRTKEKAKQICEDVSKSTMEQFESFISWCKDEYGYWDNTHKKKDQYTNRRSNTYSYILELEKQGKLGGVDLTTLGPAGSSNYIPEYGQYLWPCPQCDQINCFYGDKNTQRATQSTGKYHWGGLWHGTPHSGIDIAPKVNGIEGDECIAIGEGKVVYNTYEPYGRGYCVIIELDNVPKGMESYKYVQYMHFCKKSTLKVGDTVRRGDVIGYMGNTGASRGVHLHIGLYNWYDNGSIDHSIDILPYLGKRIR